jgi:Spy/CpxP family protein refolding chaperone
MMSDATARRARLIGIAILLATLVLGAFSGAAIDRALASKSPSPPCTETAASRTGTADRDRNRSVFEQLDLTPEQREAIDAALQRRREQTDAFWANARPILDAIVDSTRADIRAVLTPEQRAEYDRLLELKRHHRRNANRQEEK